MCRSTCGSSIALSCGRVGVPPTTLHSALLYCCSSPPSYVSQPEEVWVAKADQCIDCGSRSSCRQGLVHHACASGDATTLCRPCPSYSPPLKVAAGEQTTPQRTRNIKPFAPPSPPPLLLLPPPPPPPPPPLHLHPLRAVCAVRHCLKPPLLFKPFALHQSDRTTRSVYRDKVPSVTLTNFRRFSLMASYAPPFFYIATGTSSFSFFFNKRIYSCLTPPPTLASWGISTNQLTHKLLS